MDASKEKHVPVIEKVGNKITIKVESAPHPMEEKHYIEWVEVITNGEVHRRFLKPGESPAAAFALSIERINARAYCNLHGFWSA